MDEVDGVDEEAEDAAVEDRLERAVMVDIVGG